MSFYSSSLKSSWRTSTGDCARIRISCNPGFAGSVFDRVKKKPGAGAQPATSQAAAPVTNLIDLGHATFQQARAEDATVSVGSLEVIDEITGEKQMRVPQVREDARGCACILDARMKTESSRSRDFF